jgi:hypothetical protein
MSDLFLTDEEIAELTGKRQRRLQKEVLNHIGITHKERPDSTLIVLRAHMEEVLGTRRPARDKPPAEPNWDAMKG